MTSRKPIVAIDGPAGAGKSTIARRVAEKLGFIYVDTGAMYRAVAWKSLRAGVSLSDSDGITALAKSMTIRFDRSNGQRVFADSTDVTEAIRTPEVTRLSSPVSAISGVRRRLVEMQREMGTAGGIVMEGRDIGTVVFPDAEVKVFLTASPEERARRRQLELAEKGIESSLDDLAAQMRERDDRDSSREDSPLRQAADAAPIDTDNMTIDQVVEAVLRLCEERMRGCCSTT
ncbi:MAG: (d)CMP kinase [Armatimonadota bacterium]|nr:(d)CMP kinase [Armatimonadota bacterium]